MFEVKGLPILANEVDVLKELKRQVYAQQSREIFRKIKPSGDNIMVCCPIHNNGQEKNPSCGIATKRIKDKPPGTVHCFACGYTDSLEGMISKCFGYDDYGVFGINWLLENFANVEAYERPDILTDFSRDIIIKEATPNYVSEEELQSYRYYHPYMFQRKLTKEVINFFDIGYDKATESITFPVRDMSGNCLFITKRSINTKHFHIPKDVRKPLYGIYECSKVDNLQELYVCESQINALTCWVYGKPAVALFGTGDVSQYTHLNNLPIRRIILALDPDRAGEAGIQRLKRIVKNKILTKLIIPPGKDINNLTREEFLNLQQIFI